MDTTSIEASLVLLSGGASVLTTKQLAKCLSMNAKVISRKRQNGTFPIKHKTISSKKIVYPIANVVNFLCSDEEVQVRSVGVSSIQPAKIRASNKATLPNLSKKMMIKGLMSALLQFKDNFELSVKQLEIKISYDDMQRNVVTQQVQ